MAQHDDPRISNSDAYMFHKLSVFNDLPYDAINKGRNHNKRVFDAIDGDKNTDTQPPHKKRKTCQSSTSISAQPTQSHESSSTNSLQSSSTAQSTQICE
eukprot:351083_1